MTPIIKPVNRTLRSGNLHSIATSSTSEPMLVQKHHSSSSTGNLSQSTSPSSLNSNEKSSQRKNRRVVQKVDLSGLVGAPINKEEEMIFLGFQNEENESSKLYKSMFNFSCMFFPFLFPFFSFFLSFSPFRFIIL